MVYSKQTMLREIGPGFIPIYAARNVYAKHLFFVGELSAFMSAGAISEWI